MGFNPASTVPLPTIISLQIRSYQVDSHRIGVSCVARPSFALRISIFRLRPSHSRSPWPLSFWCTLLTSVVRSAIFFWFTGGRFHWANRTLRKFSLNFDCKSLSLVVGPLSIIRAYGYFQGLGLYLIGCAFENRLYMPTFPIVLHACTPACLHGIHGCCALSASRVHGAT